MWVVDPGSYYFLDVNEAAIQHNGYSKKEFLGGTLKDIRPDKDVDISFDYINPSFGTLVSLSLIHI